MTNVPSVLFVCVHNAGRSRMAAALLNHHAGGAVEVRSAGSVPADRSTRGSEALAEIGMDISPRAAEGADHRGGPGSDVVITMGCGDACPVFPGKRYGTGNWRTPPGRASTRSGRSVDEIDGRVESLIGELGVAPRQSTGHDPRRRCCSSA